MPNLRLTPVQKTYLQSLVNGPRMLTAKTDRTTKILEAEGLIEYSVDSRGFPTADLTEAGKAFTFPGLTAGPKSRE